MLAIVGGFSASPALATEVQDPGSQETTVPDRIVYVDGPAPELPAGSGEDHGAPSGGIGAQIAESIEVPIEPAPGETIRVIYDDAISDVTASGGCTESVTVYPPYKSSGKAIVSIHFFVSTGCSSGKTGYGFLYAVTSAANKSTYVSNIGTTTVISVSYTCNNTRTRSWYGLGRLGTAGWNHRTVGFSCVRPALIVGSEGLGCRRSLLV